MGTEYSDNHSQSSNYSHKHPATQSLEKRSGSPASPTTLPQPHHPPCPSLQVVRLRCDTKGYFNWRDQYAAAAQARTHSPRPPSQAHHSAGYQPRYIGAMNIRAHRRDLNVADRWLAFQSTRDRFKEAVRVRWRAPRLQRAQRARWGAVVKEGRHPL